MGIRNPRLKGEVGQEVNKLNRASGRFALCHGRMQCEALVFLSDKLILMVGHSDCGDGGEMSLSQD